MGSYRWHLRNSNFLPSNCLLYLRQVRTDQEWFGLVGHIDVRMWPREFDGGGGNQTSLVLLVFLPFSKKFLASSWPKLATMDQWQAGGREKVCSVGNDGIKIKWVRVQVPSQAQKLKPTPKRTSFWFDIHIHVDFLSPDRIHSVASSTKVL